jgi:hypothetical protein
MRTYRFEVKGLPPKKDGAQSMWGKRLESERLVALRQAALQALKEQPPLESNIKLTLKIHLPVNDRSIGDLDTFVTGVCDGLMATPYGGKLDPIWDNKELENIHPTNTIAIDDDSQVVSIQAEKIIGGSSQQWYKVVLEGE